MTSVGELLCILQNTLDGFVDGPAYKHAHETLIEVRRRFVSHSQRDQEQSARIAELEAENKAGDESFAESERTIERMAAKIETLEAERDAVRKALLLPSANGGTLDIGMTAIYRGDRSYPHDRTPEGVEAALLAAAREGGVK